jgi:hypothetical protein
MWTWHLPRRGRRPDEKDRKEMAERDDTLQRQREITDVLMESSSELAAEHQYLLWNNHFGLNTRSAFREGRRK